MRTLIYSALFLVLSYLAYFETVEAAEGGDTYNFYFQKAPGPTTVIQGGSPPEKALSLKETDKGIEVQQAPSVPAPAAGQSATMKTEAKPEEKKDELLRWAVRYGVATRNITEGRSWGYRKSHVFAANSVGASYSVNRYFAFDGEILFLENTDYTSEAYAIRRRDNKNTAGYLTMQITPFRLTMFGYDLMDFSFLVGATENPDLSNPNSIQTFLGLRYAINITKNFAIEARAKYTVDDHIPEYSSNLTWRF